MEKIGELLLAQGAITEDQLRSALADQEKRTIPLGTALVEAGAVAEDVMTRALAKQARLPFVDLAGKAPPARLSALLDATAAWEMEALPVKENGNVLLVAVSDPAKAVVLDTLRFLLDREVALALAAPAALRGAMEKAYGTGSGTGGGAEEIAEEDLGDEAPVVRLVHRTFREAVEARASDIHIEPFPDRCQVRYRVDGRLSVAAQHPADLHPALLSHLKVSAGLDIAEKRKPQDGRIEHHAGGRDLDIRTSILPTNHGESCVMRILDREANLISMEDLGMGKKALKWFQEVIGHPNGIFLVTGPTGSGKTTTLYAALQTLNSADRKILTVEDPVEYRIQGINQVQVHPRIGLTFARALRAFLRQAPNVILVGEIRDRETAEVAIQASLTGHLVFSTVHTNDAPGAVTRLLDMGVPPFLIATSLQGVLAQRLVRRLCPHCSTEEEAGALDRQVLGLKKGAKVRRPRGCRKCTRTGYLGRIGVFEWLAMEGSLRELLFQSTDSSEFVHLAESSGAWTQLSHDAIAKARDGQTSVEEVLRVTTIQAQPTESGTEPEEIHHE
jgi:type IV pilus assembly protein PilB